MLKKIKKKINNNVIKKCSRCKKYKSVSNFGNRYSGNNKDKQSYCKECAKDYLRELIALNKKMKKKKIIVMSSNSPKSLIFKYSKERHKLLKKIDEDKMLHFSPFEDEKTITVLLRKEVKLEDVKEELLKR
jgi:hypothetical protein